jgi:hypothetical protein
MQTAIPSLIASGAVCRGRPPPRLVLIFIGGTRPRGQLTDAWPGGPAPTPQDSNEMTPTTCACTPHSVSLTRLCLCGVRLKDHGGHTYNHVYLCIDMYVYLGIYSVCVYVCVLCMCMYICVCICAWVPRCVTGCVYLYE